VTVNRTLSTAPFRVLCCRLFPEMLDRGEQNKTASTEFYTEGYIYGKRLSGDKDIYRWFIVKDKSISGGFKTVRKADT